MRTLPLGVRAARAHARACDVAGPHARRPRLECTSLLNIAGEVALTILLAQLPAEAKQCCCLPYRERVLEYYTLQRSSKHRVA